jgi:hypothetical protein
LFLNSYCFASCFPFSFGKQKKKNTVVPQTPPLCALNVNPFSGQTLVKPDSLFSWKLNSADPMYYAVDGFYFSYGTNAFANNTVPLTNLPLGQTNYSLLFPSIWNTGTTLFWKVTPFTRSKSIPSSSCPVWNFTIGSTTTINNFPYLQTFDGGNGALPTDWRNDLLDTSVLNGVNSVDWKPTQSATFGASSDHTSGNLFLLCCIFF